MAQQNTIGKHATTIKNDGGIIRVTYHRTDIVTFNRNTHQIELNTGGYFTSTTKTRMNQASNQYNFNYKVYQKKGDWFVDHDGITTKFDSEKVSFTVSKY